MLSFLKDWGGFEDFIAELHRDGEVQVERNVKLKGKSGVTRQIDVLVTHKHGIYTHKLLIECKYWNKCVERANVDETRSTLDDLNSDKAVFFTTKGYQLGAEIYAKHHGIMLFSVRELTDTDWGAPGKIIDFYLQFLFRSAINFKFDAEISIVPGEVLDPSDTIINIVMEGPDKTETKIYRSDEQTHKTLEEIIDKYSFDALQKIFPSDTKGFTINNGADSSWYMIGKGIQIVLPGEQWIINNRGLKIRLKKFTFDLAIKLSQMRFVHDRMDNYKYAVIIEDKINNQRLVAQRKRNVEHRSIDLHAVNDSKEKVFENGSIVRMFTTHWFDPAEVQGVPETPTEYKSIKDLLDEKTE